MTVQLYGRDARSGTIVRVGSYESATTQQRMIDRRLARLFDASPAATSQTLESEMDRVLADRPELSCVFCGAAGGWRRLERRGLLARLAARDPAAHPRGGAA